jgi:hypothetical protein
MSDVHGSYVEVPRRPLTAQEAEWVRELVLANTQWADVEITDIHAVGECTCGCRSIVLEKPLKAQNPKLVGHQGLVGEIELGVKIQGKDDVRSADTVDGL